MILETLLIVSSFFAGKSASSAPPFSNPSLNSIRLTSPTPNSGSKPDSFEVRDNATALGAMIPMIYFQQVTSLLAPSLDTSDQPKKRVLAEIAELVENKTPFASAENQIQISLIRRHIMDELPRRWNSNSCLENDNFILAWWARSTESSLTSLPDSIKRPLQEAFSKAAFSMRSRRDSILNRIVGNWPLHNVLTDLCREADSVVGKIDASGRAEIKALIASEIAKNDTSSRPDTLRKWKIFKHRAQNLFMDAVWPENNIESEPFSGYLLDGKIPPIDSIHLLDALKRFGEQNRKFAKKIDPSNPTTWADSSSAKLAIKANEAIDRYLKSISSELVEGLTPPADRTSFKYYGAEGGFLFGIGALRQGMLDQVRFTGNVSQSYKYFFPEGQRIEGCTDVTEESLSDCTPVSRQFYNHYLFSIGFWKFSNFVGYKNDILSRLDARFED